MGRSLQSWSWHQPTLTFQIRFPQRTPHSARESSEPATDAMEATLRGVGSRATALSLAETSPTLDLVTLACPTVSRAALTMCLPPPRTPRAHQGSTHRRNAPRHALKMGIPRHTTATSTWPQAHTPSVQWPRSNKIL